MNAPDHHEQCTALQAYMRQASLHAGRYALQRAQPQGFVLSTPTVQQGSKPAQAGNEFLNCD